MVSALFFEIPGVADVPLPQLDEGSKSVEQIAQQCHVPMREAELLHLARIRFHEGDADWAENLSRAMLCRLKTMTRLPDGEVLWRYFDGRLSRRAPGAHAPQLGSRQ